MNKVLKVLSLSFLLCLSLVVAPFHISANMSLSAPFVGLNVYQWDVEHNTYVRTENFDLDFGGAALTCNSVNSSGICSIYAQNSNNAEIVGKVTGTASTSTYYMYRYDLILDDDYVGSVTINTKEYYVNGNVISWIVSGAEQNITISSYNLTRKDDSPMWAFPIESVPVIRNMFRQGFTNVGFYEDNLYIYPMFQLNQNDQIALGNVGSGTEVILVYFMDRSIANKSNFDIYFTDTLDFVSNERIHTITRGFISKLTLKNNSDSTIVHYLNYINASSSYFFPIYYQIVQDEYPVSTDFALTYNLQNRILNDLDIISNGTSSSVSSQSDLNQKTDDLSQSSNQLVTQEDTFNNNMNSALQDVNTDFNFGSNFGSKFIASADWVKTQYDRLTGNTPFGSVISFSLLIGLALLLVGKVFK